MKFMQPARSSPLETAKTLLRKDFIRFDACLEAALQEQVEYLSATEYEIYRRGKRLRPLILLLAARACSGEGELPEKVIQAAVSLEMLHVATLIHDDIVDVAPTRRGLPTVFSERGTEMAVLIGDLQFLQAVRCFASGVNAQEDMHLVRAVLDVGFRICCGELDELLTSPDLAPESLLARYFRTVDRKTAALFGLACESGATLVGAGKRQVFFLSRYGRRFGVAFQIMDDIFDLVRPESLSGKAPGTDLQQGVLALPVIYALEELSDPDHVLRRVMKRQPHTPEEFRSALDAIIDSSGLLRAYSKAREIALEGCDYLGELPESPYRDSLDAIAQHVVNRGYLSPEG